MTIADTGYNSAFAIGTTAAQPVFTDVAEVVSITPPAMSRTSVEATHLKSPNGWQQFIAGIKDGGEASFTLNWQPAANDVMATAFNAEAGNYRITFPNGVNLRWAGFFLNYTMPELTVDGVMQATVTVKVTGAATLHAAV